MIKGDEMIWGAAHRSPTLQPRKTAVRRLMMAVQPVLYLNWVHYLQMMLAGLYRTSRKKERERERKGRSKVTRNLTAGIFISNNAGSPHKVLQYQSQVRRD